MLRISNITKEDSDGEIIEAELTGTISSNRYPVSNGIPRFVKDSEYNRTWDYKWTAIDRGAGHNYRIADKSDPAYEIHDLFDRNSHGGKAYRYATGRLALDLGCGIGQYSWRMLREHSPEKLVAVDLTRGVDIFRKIMLERFPEFKSRLLIVQASVFELPFEDETFDYVFSLGVLMHTGDTRKAIRHAARVLKYDGQMNVWLYAAETVHIDVREDGRTGVRTMFTFVPYQLFYAITMAQVKIMRRLPMRWATAIIRAFSSDFWYRLSRIPVVKYFAWCIFGTVMHPDREYRYINMFDGWCNTWADTWSEHEIFPVLRDADVVIKGIGDWRTGIWGVKLKGFYS
jgi:ubiquinone/menaquinone biosynthesis C-methylase UbiE